MWVSLVGIPWGGYHYHKAIPMNDLVEFDFREMVSVSGDEVITSSLKVAEYFGKRHSDVMRAIGSIKCSIGYRQRNYAETFYVRKNPKGGKGIKTKMYTMTRDGLVFLIMGFTGTNADHIKEQYINAFNWMANKLKELQNAPVIELMANLKALPEITKRASFYGKGLRETGMAKKKLTQRIDELTAQIQLPLLD